MDDQRGGDTQPFGVRPAIADHQENVLYEHRQRPRRSEPGRIRRQLREFRSLHQPAEAARFSFPGGDSVVYRHGPRAPVITLGKEDRNRLLRFQAGRPGAREPLRP